MNKGGGGGEARKATSSRAVALPSLASDLLSPASHFERSTDLFPVSLSPPRVFCLAIILGTLVYTGAPAYLLPSATSSYVSSSYAQKLLSIGPQVGFHVPAENLPLAPPPILPTTLLSADAGYHAFGSLYLKNGTIFLLSPPGARAYNDKKGGGGGFRDILGRELETLGRITSTGRMSATDMAYRVPTEEDIRAPTLFLAFSRRGHQGLNLLFYSSDV